MDVRSEIVAHVDNLSGTALRRFAGSIDRASAREMTQAIEQECERVDGKR
jgi:hypothetical protein